MQKPPHFIDQDSFRALTVKELQNLINKGFDVNARLSTSKVNYSNRYGNRRPCEELSVLQDYPNSAALISEKPLEIAVHQRKYEIVDTLLNGGGANVNARNLYGHTALMIAANKQDIQMIKILLEANADTSIEDHKRHTALYYALTSAFSLRGTTTLQKVIIPIIEKEISKGRTLYDFLMETPAEAFFEDDVREAYKHCYEASVKSSMLLGMHERVGKHSSIRKAFNSVLADKKVLRFVFDLAKIPDPRVERAYANKAIGLGRGLS